MSKKLRFSGLIEWQKLFLALASNIFEWKVKHLRVTGPAASWGLTCSCWCLAVAGAGGGGEAGPGLHRDLRWSPRPLPRPHPAPPGGSGSAWRCSCHSWTSGVTELSRGCGDNIHPGNAGTPVYGHGQSCGQYIPLYVDNGNVWTIYRDNATPDLLLKGHKHSPLVCGGGSWELDCTFSSDCGIYHHLYYGILYRRCRVNKCSK